MIYQYLLHVFLKCIQNNLEYLISGNPNLSFHVGGDILNLLLLYELFYFFHVQYMLIFDKTITFLPILKSTLLVSLSIKTCRIFTVF